MTYELCICGEKESHVLEFGEYEYYKLVQVAQELIDRGMTVRIHKVSNEEG